MVTLCMYIRVCYILYIMYSTDGGNLTFTFIHHVLTTFGEKKLLSWFLQGIQPQNMPVDI